MTEYSYNAFCRFALGLIGKGQGLRTVGGRSNFELESVTDAQFTFLISTGKKRVEGKKCIEGIIERYLSCGSFKPKDYQDISVNSSYVLAILKSFLKK
jgi:hypothetical protein